MAVRCGRLCAMIPVLDFIVAVSFAAGINAYLTVLTLGLLGRYGGLTIPSALQVVTSPWVIGASAVLFAGGFFLDKVPGLDLIWNAAHTFVRIPAAALMAYGAGQHLSPEMHTLVVCLATVVASAAHGTKLVGRVAVTPSPEPVSNIVLSVTEDAAAAGMSWLSLRHPEAGAIAAATALVLLCVLARWAWVRVAVALEGLRVRWSSMGARGQGRVGSSRTALRALWGEVTLSSFMRTISRQLLKILARSLG